MLKKTITLIGLCVALAACAQEQPRIIQPTAESSELRLQGGMATQVELPAGNRVQSVVVGNPDLVTAEHVDDVVNLMPKDKSGETNLIVRSRNQSGDAQVYQYRVIVQGH